MLTGPPARALAALGVRPSHTLSDVAAVRDSKDPDGPRLTFSPGDWRAFTARIRASQLDLG